MMSNMPSRDSQSGAIMTYLAVHNGNVTLQQMADHFGYQKNYLSRLCKKLFESWTLFI